MEALPLMVILALTRVPNFVLVGLAIYLFILGRRLREQDWWASIALSSLAAVEGTVAMIRFGGLSLAAAPWFDNRMLVVHPLYESALLLVALTLLLGVVPFAVWMGRRQSEPSRPAPRIWTQGLGHAFLILCLVANGSFLGLHPRHASGAPVLSPDGRTEVCLVLRSAMFDQSSQVLYRRKGAWAWRFCTRLRGPFSPDVRWSFTWNPDSTEVVYRGSYKQGKHCFVMRGDKLEEADPKPVDLTTDSAATVHERRASLLMAIDYTPAEGSQGQVPWRMTVDARGLAQWVVGEDPMPAVPEKQLAPEQVGLLRDLVKTCVSGDVPNGEGDHLRGETYFVSMRQLGKVQFISYSTETRGTNAHLPQVQGVERLLHTLLQWVPPPNPDQQRHLFQPRQPGAGRDTQQ